jgi:hypothetical protein
MDMNDQANQYQQIIAKCWADEAFKQRLMADPTGTLKGEGIEIPEGVTVSICENTENKMHIVIPCRPLDITDDDLEHAAGGKCSCLSVW